MRLLKPVSYASVTAVYILIVLGGYVSSSGAGLACPDWPLCHGEILPPLTPLVMIEWAHRAWTLVVTVMIFLTMALAWKDHRDSPGIVASSTLSSALLLVQIVVGMLSVRMELHPATVTAHLGLATILFGSSLITAVLAHRLQS